MGSHSHSNRLVVYCREACSRALLIAPVLSQFSVDQFESPWCSLVFADEFIPCTWQDSGVGCRNLLAPLLLFHMRMARWVDRREKTHQSDLERNQAKLSFWARRQTLNPGFSCKYLQYRLGDTKRFYPMRAWYTYFEGPAPSCERSGTVLNLSKSKTTTEFLRWRWRHSPFCSCMTTTMEEEKGCREGLGGRD
jgi:hypothetical protein